MTSKSFDIPTMLWSVLVAAACFAAYQYDVRLAPSVASMYAVFFLTRPGNATSRELWPKMRVGAVTACLGVACWTTFVLIIDLSVILQSETAFDLKLTLTYLVVSLGFLIVFGMLAAVAGAIYGLIAYVIQASASAETPKSSGQG